jgi:hypothetical protein
MRLDIDINDSSMWVWAGTAYTKPPFMLRTQYFISRMLDKLDTIADKVVNYFTENLFTRVTFQGVIIIMVLTVMYFAAVVVALVVLPIAMVFITDIYLWMIGGAAVNVYFIFIMYVFISARSQKFKAELISRWQVNIVGLIILYATSLFLFGIFTALLIVLLAAIQDTNSVWFDRVIAIIVAVAVLATAFLVTAIILSLKRGGPKKTYKVHLEEPPEELSKKQNTFVKFAKALAKHVKLEKWFPWWFIFVDLLLCYIYIGVTSFVLILYGIRFSSEGDGLFTGGQFNMKAQDVQWLLGSFMSMTSSAVIFDPATFIVKTIFYVTLVKLMIALFFPGQATKQIPATPERKLISSHASTISMEDIEPQT